MGTSSTGTWRPSLQLWTVCFAEGDREVSRALGFELYDLLTRPLRQPLAHGPGIQVWVAAAPDAVELEAAENVVIVPVLGRASFQDRTVRDRVLARTQGWHETLGLGHVLPVFASANWRSIESKLPGKAILRELYGDGGDDARRQRTIQEIVLAVSRVLVPTDDRNPLKVFVSHAKADLAETATAAERIRNYIATETTGTKFFDATDLLPGSGLAEQIEDASGDGVFIVVRGDRYSSRTWCKRELLQAKRRGIPTLTLLLLTRGEDRSLSYGGNGRTVVWDENAGAVVTHAMVEWLRATHFRLDGKRMIRLAGLPSETTIACRPPELLDLAQGPIEQHGTTVVFHPDPELSVDERAVIRGAHPRLRLLTPSTLFRPVLGGVAGSTGASLLAGHQVALSLSSSPDAEGAEGFTEAHISDAIVHIARSLIAAGAELAFGGHFLPGGYTPLLVELIAAYNGSASEPAEFLHSYVAPVLPGKGADIAATVHAMSDSGSGSMIAAPTIDQVVSAHRKALYYSDMRRVMAKHVLARVVVGGNSRPRGEDSPGYGGRLPGIVEEAWRMLELGKPVYVVGGYGGGAGLLADLFENRDTPEPLKDQTFANSQEFRERARSIDNDPDSERLGLPKSIDALAASVRKLAQDRLRSNESALAWNGLTLAQNRRLLRTRDPIEISSLVLSGLLRVACKQSKDKLYIELVHGGIEQAEQLSAVAVAAFSDAPMGGAGAALDRVLAGRISAGRAVGESMIAVGNGDVDTEWVLVASLGPLAEAQSIPQCVERAAREIRDLAVRHGFRRVGVVTFGATVSQDLTSLQQAMVSGLSGSASPLTVVWFEVDGSRFERLRASLEGRDDVTLATRRLLVPRLPQPPGDVETILSVTRESDALHVAILPPNSRAAVFHVTLPMTDSRLGELVGRFSSASRSAPRLSELGKTLANDILGSAGVQVLANCGDSRLVVLHDVASSSLPFEAMRIGDDRPALKGGLVRRPALDALSPERVFLRPPRVGELNVLLVVNPTEDLPGTEAEAAEIRRILSTMKIRLRLLERKNATKSALLDALADSDVDILHYSGHAFFDGFGDEASGLLCADGRLTLDDLSNATVGARVAFVNACESARVRGVAPVVQATAFAEFFLLSGVETYIGTFLEVADAAAARFAASVYTRLAADLTLEAAVREGRRSLFDNGDKDWANYLLYGHGDFRLHRAT